MFPDIALLTSGLGILQRILSIRVLLLLDILLGRRIWGCNELEARSSKISNQCDLSMGFLVEPSFWFVARTAGENKSDIREYV